MFRKRVVHNESFFTSLNGFFNWNASKKAFHIVTDKYLVVAKHDIVKFVDKVCCVPQRSSRTSYKGSLDSG